MLAAGSLSAAGSPVGDVVGKLTVGYQGWFSCSNDASPEAARWRHWIISNTTPRPGNTHFDLYPDVREYTTTYATGYANFGNGSPARLFSSYSDQVVDKHFEWMQTYGIDTVALQRFGCSLSDTNSKAWKDGIAVKVKNAAQNYGRKFYIMYDLSDWTSFQSDIKKDWTNTITGALGLTNSGAYAKQNGKPVVCVWGIGCDGRPGSNTSWNDVVNFFKGKNCYVIMGVKRTWATNTISVYTNGHMISPWSVGGFTNTAGADSYANLMATDQTKCNNRGQDYLPVVWAGFSWYNWHTGETKNKTPRYHGDFMWRQYYNVRNKNIPSVYVAMFDEYDEATAIAKAAENSSMIPTDQWFLTLDYDGVACSSDFYLRLTGDGARMVKTQTGLTSAHPTSHIISTNPNVVINPSVETDAASWTLTGLSARSTDTAAEGGIASMMLSGANAYARQTIPLEMGKTYEISAWVNVTALTAGKAYFDTSDKYDATGQGQFTFSVTNGGWQRYWGSFTATNTSITLRCFTAANFAGTAYYDLIDVRPK
jgi:hypothetical protein